MVHFLQNPVDPGGNIKGMIECAGSVEQDHAGDEDCHGGCADRISCPMSPNQQRSGPGSCGNNADKMSDRTSRIFQKRFLRFCGACINSIHIDSSLSFTNKVFNNSTCSI